MFGYVKPVVAEMLVREHEFYKGFIEPNLIKSDLDKKRQFV